MPNDEHTAYAAWKQADEEARVVEAQLARAQDAHRLADGPPPSDALVQTASRLRAEANSKLTLALVMLRAAANDAHATPIP
jgi:hypothetical protein